MGYQMDRAFTAVHAFLASTIHAAGPWAVPGVLAVAGIVGIANRERLVSGFGAFLVFATAGVLAVVLAFQNGRI